MNLQITRTKDTLNIAVIGNIYKKNDIEKLVKEFENINEENVQITFFDARVLSEKIIDKLLLFNLRKGFKLQVAHNALSSYLYRLGINHVLLANKSINEKDLKKIKAIGIGGSAGSLERIIYILHVLPKADISIFIVQHILERSPNYLASILNDKTNGYTVKEAENNEIVRNGYVYVAPPGYQMKVEKGKILLTKDPPAYFARPSIDVLFESLCYEYKSSLMTVLLSGYNDDGSHSLGLLRQEKATVLIQDPEECIEKELLLNAIKTKNYNYIFPLPELAHYLKRHLEPKEITLDKNKIKVFLENILEKYGYDYRGYHYDSISRLIIKEMSEQGIESFDKFAEQVLNWSESFEALFLEFSVNVTEFFRNPQVFKKARNDVFGYLASFPHIKIWCAGCSTGEEPYSLAIILKEEGLLHKSQIYATDINPFIIEQAKNGYFSEGNIEKNIKNYHESGGKADFKNYFDKVGNALKIKDEIKDKILFFQHSLVSKGVLNEFNLILCRNVIIYFDDFLQDQTMELFNNSLSHNGFIILGESEYVKNTNLFNFYDKNLKILKKSY